MSNRSAPRVATSLVFVASGEPDDVEELAVALSRLRADQELVLVSTGPSAGLHALLRRSSDRIRSVVLDAGSLLDRTTVVRAAEAVAAGANVELLGRSEPPSDTAPGTACLVSFIVDCNGDPSPVARTVVSVVRAASSRADWDAELVLSGVDRTRLEELAAAFGGDISIHAGPGLPSTRGAVVVSLGPPDVLDAEGVATVDSALADLARAGEAR